jgi:hypothetical protein
MAPDPGDDSKKTGERFFDAVGTALYSVDIHPSKGEPPLLVRALPYYLPLGSFIPRSGPPNLLPAAKNFGATRLALASARMHPTEWLAGEIAGNLAAFCLRGGADPYAPVASTAPRVEPTEVRNTPTLLAAFQEQLRRSGVTLTWDDVLNPQP